MNYGHIIKKDVNQIMLNCVTLQSLALRILEVFAQIFLIVNIFLNQTLLTFYSMWDRPGWLNWFWQFLCEGSYLLSIRKGFTTHMHSLAVYAKEGLPFALDFSLEILVNLSILLLNINVKTCLIYGCSLVMFFFWLILVVVHFVLYLSINLKRRLYWV